MSNEILVYYLELLTRRIQLLFLQIQPEFVYQTDSLG